MFKKMVPVFLLALLCQVSFAETCPSVKAIKANTLHGWKAYDSDDGKPLSTAREKQFKQMIQQFALAEWAHTKTSSIHCYYIDSTGSSLEAYLAKDHVEPQKKRSHYWYQVSGFMHCAASKENCEFKQQVLKKHQLAKK